MAKDITKTPVKLYAQVARGLASKFKALIDDHGLTFAVNSALADYLRSLGVSISVLETPTDKMKRAQRNRWRVTNKAKAEAEIKAKAKRKARRAKRKVEQSASGIEAESVAMELRETEKEGVDFL